jgi:hypothetical protein
VRGAAGEQVKQRYMRYYGQLVEAYALELAESSYAAPEPMRRVHGEQRYGKGGGKKTSDIAVDSFPDLVLFEIGAGRLKESSRVLARWDDVESDLKKLVLVRVKKLNGVVDALESDEARIPNIVSARLRAIWPVIVTAGSVIQSEILWDYIDEHRNGMLEQPRVQPLTLLDLDDFELLMGLVEKGASLVDVLRRKSESRFRTFDLQQWLEHDPTAPKEQRSALMERRMGEVFLTFGRRLGFSEEQLAPLRVSREAM